MRLKPNFAGRRKMQSEFNRKKLGCFQESSPLIGVTDRFQTMRSHGKSAFHQALSGRPYGSMSQFDDLRTSHERKKSLKNIRSAYFGFGIGSQSQNSQTFNLSKNESSRNLHQKLVSSSQLNFMV